MPRNGSSVYSLPAGNPVVPGTVIATTWANTTLTDIATALTNSLSTDGSTASVSLSGKTITSALFTSPAVGGTMNLFGGQILFPAVAVPSANVNTLDDYEEGTFTPVFSFVTPGNLNVVYSSQTAAYTKVGRAVTVSIQAVTTTFTHTTASGQFLISGLPFTAALSGQAACAMHQGIISGGAGLFVIHYVVSGVTLLAFESGAGAAITAVTTGAVISGTQQNCSLMLTYQSP